MRVHNKMFEFCNMHHTRKPVIALYVIQ